MVTQNNHKPACMAAVVFCPYGQVSIFIDSSLLFPVPFPWVVDSWWSLHLSPVTSSVNIFLGLTLPFFPGNRPSNTVLTSESWRNTCPNNHFCLFINVSRSSLLASTALSTSSFFLCSVQDILSMRRYNFPPRVGIMNIIKSQGVNMHATWFAVLQCKLVPSWGLRDTSYT